MSKITKTKLREDGVGGGWGGVGNFTSCSINRFRLKNTIHPQARKQPENTPLKNAEVPLQQIGHCCQFNGLATQSSLYNSRMLFGY